MAKKKQAFVIWLNAQSRVELAKKLGILPSAINHWKHHRCLPGAAVMRKIQTLSGGKITYAVMINEFLRAQK